MKEIKSSRVFDIISTSNKGYVFDTPVVYETLSDYTTFTKTSVIFNISNRKILNTYQQDF